MARSDDGAGRTRDEDMDRSMRPSADYSALIGLASTLPSPDGPAAEGRLLTNKERKELRRELRMRMREVDAAGREASKASKTAEKAERARAKSVQRQLRERDRALEKKSEDRHARRARSDSMTDFVGYERMFRDGICEVADGVFSQTISFPDISYQSARDDRQREVFATWCSVLDYFGSDVSVQLSVTNTPIPAAEVGRREFFDPASQPTEETRRDAETFNRILNEKMREGVSNIRRERTITYSISADSAEAAVPRLARIRNDVCGLLSKIGCDARVLDGTERLERVHSLLRPGRPFSFDYDVDVSLSSGLSTKDYVCPTSIDFKPRPSDPTCFRSDGKWCQVLVMRRFGSELTDRALSNIVEIPIPLSVVWFVSAMDNGRARDFVNLRMNWIDKEIIDEQRRAVSKGYDFTVIPQELRYSKEEAEELLSHMKNDDQRLFEFTGLVYTYADTREELEERVLRIVSTARCDSIDVETLDYRQREGLNSILPLGMNHVDVSRYFTTAQVGILVPFATQELDMPGGTYCGQNRGSSNLVVCNRKALASPVGFICGKTGSGKSFFVKQEIEGTFLTNPDDQIVIFDRAGEYRMLAAHLGGNEFRFAVDSPSRMNPFDLSTLAGQSMESQIAFKVDAMLAQAQASATEAGHALDEGEQSIIARVVELAFARASARGDGKPPLLGDFYEILTEQPEEQARTLALRYERFVSGSMGFFNHQSNVDWDARVIEIDVRELPDSMIVFALVNMCEAVRNQMYRNDERGRRTWIYIEEIQSMFRYPSVLNYFSRFAREARKFGGLITGITQNSIAMLETKEARDIVLSADFVMLLKQSALDRQAWTDLLSLSAQEEGFVDETCDKGSGLLMAGAARVPIVGGFPRGNELYDLFATDPEDGPAGICGEG